MVKITFEIVNPISALGKKIATRKIEKINAKIDKLNAQKSKLESKFFNDSKKVDSDKVTEATQKVAKKTNTIFFKKEIVMKNRLAIMNDMKKVGVKVSIYQTEKMKASKKHDDMLMKCINGSSDTMVRRIKEKMEWYVSKGLHPEPFERMVNKGGEIL